MTSPFNPFDVVEFLMIGMGAILLFKRLVDMDRYYEPRLFVITLILSLVVTIFLIGYGFRFVDYVNTDCPEKRFCHTEM